MKITLSAIKADIGSIGGHIQPSQRLVDTVRGFVSEHGSKLLLDSYISYTGDDIAIVRQHPLLIIGLLKKPGRDLKLAA